MTAPDKIWAWGHTRSLTNGGWMGHAIGYADAEYTRTNLIQAMIDKAVGEERERCAQVCDAVSLAAHLATGLAGDDEITTRVGAASYASAAEHIAAAIRNGGKP